MYQREEVNLGNLEAIHSTLAMTTQTKKLKAKEILTLIIIWIFLISIYLLITYNFT